MTLRALYDVPAPAKLNLFLHVVGRRADGYHLLQSVFVLDRLGRHAALRTARRRRAGPPRPRPGAARRRPVPARRARAAGGQRHHARAPTSRSLKHVPWGAGMGGGSSDAATTLLALNRLWGLGWPRARLAAAGPARSAPTCRSSWAATTPSSRASASGSRRWRCRPARYAVVKPPTAIATQRHLRAPAPGSRHRSCYTCGLS